MKKITLLLALFLSFSVFSQDSDVTVSIKNKEGVNFDQYDLIKDVNRLYPDILVRMLYKSLGEKRTVQYYIDGKLINEVKN